MANYTQRHIVSVPLKNVKSTEDLYKVFYGRTINKQPIPVNKRIYVLEDIDAASLENVVNRRDEATNGEKIDAKIDEIAKTTSGETSPKKEEGNVLAMKEAKPKLTLA